LHELAITEAIVDGIVERTGGDRVVHVVLEIGTLSGIVPDAIRFCFDVCSRGTPLEDATLEIVCPSGHGACRACGESMPVTDLAEGCACGSRDIAIRSGTELRVREVEVL
jgi:hydrogenase nickel incorporation protein HypA/HybF